MDSHSKSPPTIIVVLAVRGRVSIMSTRRPAHELRVVCCFVGLACATLRAGVLSVLHQCFHSIVLRRRPQRKEPVSPERRRQDDDNDHGVYLGVCVCVCFVPRCWSCHWSCRWSCRERMCVCATCPMGSAAAFQPRVRQNSWKLGAKVAAGLVKRLAGCAPVESGE